MNARPPLLTLLQVCNVGQIVGGTAACAWTVTRALPDVHHQVAFLGRAAPETVRQFAPVPVQEWPRVTRKLVASTGADLVLLHNTTADRAETPLPVVTINYLHSRIQPAPAELTLCCSAWLAREQKLSAKQVCLQAVPRPVRSPELSESRELRTNLVVGRICTPQRAKWPHDVAEFYAPLAARFPGIRWEFVGCPPQLQSQLHTACEGNAEFLAPSWNARARLWHWDALLYHNAQLTESFGRTVAEALRAGCIPIVDRRGGFTEQFPPDIGFLCDSQREFCDALATLQQPGERRRRSRACQNHGDTCFSLSRFRADLLAHFRTAAKYAPQA